MAGQTGKCPACGLAVAFSRPSGAVPAPLPATSPALEQEEEEEGTYSIPCPNPNCTETLDLPPSMAGQYAECPTCGEEFFIEGPNGEGPPPEIPFSGIRLKLVGCLLGATMLLSTIFYSLAVYQEVSAASAILNGEETAVVAAGTGVFMVLGLLSGLAALVCSILFTVKMYKAWKHVIAWSAAAGVRPWAETPGQAIGFLFIPFFNLYWMFRWFGIGGNLNEISRACRLRVPKAPHGLGMAFAATSILTGPFLSPLFLVPFVLGLERSLNAVGEILGGVDGYVTPAAPAAPAAAPVSPKESARRKGSGRRRGVGRGPRRGTGGKRPRRRQ